MLPPFPKGKQNSNFNCPQRTFLDTHRWPLIELLFGPFTMHFMDEQALSRAKQGENIGFNWQGRRGCHGWWVGVFVLLWKWMLLVNYYICNIDDDVLLDCGLWSGQTSDNTQINIISLTQPEWYYIVRETQREIKKQLEK